MHISIFMECCLFNAINGFKNFELAVWKLDFKKESEQGKMFRLTEKNFCKIRSLLSEMEIVMLNAVSFSTYFFIENISLLKINISSHTHKGAPLNGQGNFRGSSYVPFSNVKSAKSCGSL